MNKKLGLILVGLLGITLAACGETSSSVAESSSAAASSSVVTSSSSSAASSSEASSSEVGYESLGNMVNGDFANGLEGWTGWANDTQGVTAAFSAVGGEAIIDITAQSIILDNNWWDVQLKQTTLILEGLTSYTLKFTIRAEAPRKMMLNLQGGNVAGMPWKTIEDNLIDVTTTAVEHSVDFLPKGPLTNAELQFAFGTFLKVAGVAEAEQTVLGKTYVSDVHIVEGPVVPNQAPVITCSNVLLKVGTEDFIRKAGVTVADDRDVIDIEDVLVFDISDGANYVEPAVKGAYHFMFIAVDSAGLITQQERWVVVRNPMELVNGDFSSVEANGVPTGWQTWYEETNGGLTTSTVGGVAAVTLTHIAAAGNPWENQFKITGLAPFTGHYTLSFKIKADIARPIILAMEGDGGNGLPNFYQVIEATPTETLVTIDLIYNQADPATYDNRNLQFFMGSYTNGGFDLEGLGAEDNILTTVYFSEFSCVEVPA